MGKVNTEMDDSPVTIGEAAARSGLTARAVRLYEQRGLLGPPERTPGGYHTYGSHQIATLGFIRQAKAVSLRLAEIGQILDLQRSGRQPCETVVDLLDQRIADIDRTMTDLRALRRNMAAARDRATDAARAGQCTMICRLIESAH